MLFLFFIIQKKYIKKCTKKKFSKNFNEKI